MHRSEGTSVDGSTPRRHETTSDQTNGVGCNVDPPINSYPMHYPCPTVRGPYFVDVEITATWEAGQDQYKWAINKGVCPVECHSPLRNYTHNNGDCLRA